MRIFLKIFVNQLMMRKCLKMKIFKSNVNRNKNIKKLRVRIENILKKKKLLIGLKYSKKKAYHQQRFIKSVT